MQGTPPEVLAAHDFWWWFGPWLDAFRASRECMLLVVSSALLAWRAAQGPGRSAVRTAGEWGAVAACLLGILEWGTGAPDLRYGNFWFWMLPAVLFAPMVADGMRNAHVRTAVVAFSIALCAWSGGFAFHETVSVPKLWGRPPAPQRAKTTHNVTGDTDVLVPTTDDRSLRRAIAVHATAGHPDSARSGKSRRGVRTGSAAPVTVSRRASSRRASPSSPRVRP